MNRAANNQRAFAALDASLEPAEETDDPLVVSFAKAISVIFRPNFNSLLVLLC